MYGCLCRGFNIWVVSHSTTFVSISMWACALYYHFHFSLIWSFCVNCCPVINFLFLFLSHISVCVMSSCICIPFCHEVRVPIILHWGWQCFVHNADMLEKVTFWNSIYYSNENNTTPTPHPHRKKIHVCTDCFIIEALVLQLV